MKIVEIQRIHQDDCTIGILNIGKFRCFTLELPWRNNQNNVSCIPSGTYIAQKHTSPTKGKCIELLNVPLRSNILIHIGNFTSDIRGCILVGDSARDINSDGTYDVTNSRRTLQELLLQLPEAFLVRID